MALRKTGRLFSLVVILAVVVVFSSAFILGQNSQDEDEEKQELAFEGKNYDFRFSLAGGNISGQFNLSGNFLYAREFGEVFFAQAAGFADISGGRKEYGVSMGIGANAQDEAFSFYLFGDSLYSYQNWWFQVRPTIRMRTEYLGLEAFYAVPIRVASIFNLQSANLQDTVYINGKEVWAVNYWGGKAEIVPVDWARVYGKIMLVQKMYKKFKVGAEVRLWKYFSLSVNWHKQDPGIYSSWEGYDDFSIALNILFGAKQESFSPSYTMAVTPMYPILAEKKKEPEPPKAPEPVDVVIKYERVYDHVGACPVIPSHSDWGVTLNGDLKNRALEKIEEDLYQITLKDVPVNYPDGDPYKVCVTDGLWNDLSNQHLGCHQRAHNLYINGKLMKNIYKQRVHGEYILVKIDQNGNAHENF